MRMEGRVAIVTGGARGIGRAYTERFLREGASVLIADVDDAHGSETVAELSELGVVDYAHCDVADVDSGGGVRRCHQGALRSHRRPREQRRPLRRLGYG